MTRGGSTIMVLVLGGLLVLAVSSCVSYTPGSLLHRGRKWAQARTIGCLDVATEIVGDKEVPADSPVVDLTFGNRCTEGVRVDLSKVRVVGWFKDGTRQPLAVYDPHHEIETKVLGPAGVGREAIEFDPQQGQSLPTRLCVHVAGIDADHPESPAPPMCFASAEGGMLPIALGQVQP